MNTKSILTSALLGAAALLFNACDGGGPSASEDAPRDPGRLNLYTWSEYVPQEVIDAFQDETGIRVSLETYSSNEEMLAKLLAGGGNYDIILPSEYVVEALIRENELMPLDHEKIPNLRNIAPEFLDMAFDPGNRFSVPWMAGTVGIVVNTEMVDIPVEGYADVFQDRFRNNIVVLDDAREIVSWALAYHGIDINDVSDENLAKIRPTLETWLPLVRVYDSDSPKTALLNGDVAVGIVWNGEGAILLNEDSKFAWTLPREGAHLFVDNLAIPKNARNADNAMLFMNFILRPEISRMISDEFPYLNPNEVARQILDDEQLQNEASFPPVEDLATLSIFTDIGDQASKVDEIVTSVKAR
jgi:spermidine/putrescine transport system permease protein